MKRFSNKKRKKSNLGQVLLEFTFCMIIVMLMIYGLIKILRWSGVDLAQRRIGHDETLFKGGFVEDYTRPDGGDGTLQQIDPYFYQPAKMNAVWLGP